MEYNLSAHVQLSKKGKDGKNRNYLLYFLNDVLILKQKMPFDPDYDYGYELCTTIDGEYLLNGNLYQTRQRTPHPSWWRTWKQKSEGKVRHVKYPISKKILKQFNIPKDLKIVL